MMFITSKRPAPLHALRARDGSYILTRNGMYIVSVRQ